MRERGPREASAREESEVCMERKRSEEIRGESGDGIVGDDEGRERAEGQKAGWYSLSRTPGDGVVSTAILLYPLLHPTTVTARLDCCFDLRSSSQKLACSPSSASVPQPQRRRYDCMPAKHVLRGRVGPANNILVFHIRLIPPSHACTPTRIMTF